MKRACLCTAILVVFVQGSLAWAGQLDDFEKDATKDIPNQEIRKEKHKASETDFLDAILDPLGDVFFGGLYKILEEGGRASWRRASCSHEGEKIDCRHNGEPLLPILKVDVNYQRLQSDITAIDGRVEVGYGPFGISYRGTRFREVERPEEGKPSDIMNLHEIYALYRISGTKYFEIDLGLGQATLEGNESHSGPSFTIPVKIHPLSWLGFHVAPAVSGIRGNPIYEMDGSILFTTGLISLRAGYRWLSTENETLNGPYAGFSVHY